MVELGKSFKSQIILKFKIYNMKYKCDRCSREHELDESKVKNKQHYIRPYSCFEGDYYVDAYFWFECDCGRAIEVKKEHLSHPYQIEKEYSEHRGVCPAVSGSLPSLDDATKVSKTQKPANCGYTVLATVPYQKCPVCEGMGQIFVNQLDPYNTNSSIGYKPCHVCGGSGIIPMHVLPCSEVK